MKGLKTLQYQTKNKKCFTMSRQRHLDMRFNDKFAPNRSTNLLGAIICGQTTGNAIRRLSQLSEYSGLLDELVVDHLYTLEQLADLDLLSRGIDTKDKNKIYSSVKDLYTKAVNFEARRNNACNKENIYNTYCRTNIEFGAVPLLLRVLMLNTVLPQESRFREDSAEDLRTKSVCLELLSRFVTVKPEGMVVAESLVARPDVLNYVFSLLCYDQTCHTAMQFIEDLLQAQPGVLNLKTISNIRPLVERFDDKKLTNFCRVLALTISDLDIYENKSSLYAQNKQKRTKGFVNIRDVNQELLLGIPDLMSRLVRIACFKGDGGVSVPRYMGINSEMDNWMEWIEDQLSDDAFDTPRVDDLDNFVGGISEPLDIEAPFVRQSGLVISMDLIARIQVVYVLGLFLVGKHRKKVQKKLAELHLIPGLSEVFDQFIWKCQGSNHGRLRGHSSTTCECSPEVAVKIQFLRLVHSFCDHSEFKHLLLSKVELHEIQDINSRADAMRKIGSVDKINRALMCRGSRGLLTKIVEIMKNEPTASTFRFWLARAIESYLRGSTSYCDQIFLLRRGLLQHITLNIVDYDIRPKEILQSSFDLLGELCKFNVESFRAFDKVLYPDARLQKFVAVINRNLVDSNMFIRSLVLSYEHFNTVQSQCKDYAQKQSRVLRHVAGFEQQMTYLSRLISTINVENLTQENVSCLNTTLVFLMFANRKGEIPRFLRGVLSSAPLAGKCISNVNVMKNFRDLLMFWQDHYLHKDKDCSALEKSSRIPFEYWKNTVHLLVEDTTFKPTAILHYMDADISRGS